MLYQIVSILPWYAWIAIIGIVSGSFSSTACAWFKHRERMAMIRQGMNPDDANLDRVGSKTNYPEL